MMPPAPVLRSVPAPVKVVAAPSRSPPAVLNSSTAPAATAWEGEA